MKKTSILMLIAVPMMMACGHARIPVEFSPYEMISRPSMDKDRVIQIIGKSEVQRPYTVIGTVTATRTHEEDPMAVFAKLRKLAKKKGGDALVDLKVMVRLQPITGPEDLVRYTAEIVAFVDSDRVQAR